MCWPQGPECPVALSGEPSFNTGLKSFFLSSLPPFLFLSSFLPSFLPIFQQDIYRCLLYRGIPWDKHGLILYGVSRLAERNPYPPGNVPEILQASWSAQHSCFYGIICTWPIWSTWLSFFNYEVTLMKSSHCVNISPCWFTKSPEVQSVQRVYGTYYTRKSLRYIRSSSRESTN